MPDEVIIEPVDGGIDFISAENNRLVADGPVAQRLLQSNFNPSVMRTLDVLQKEEWLVIDRAVITQAQERLRAAADLFSAGLTIPLANALGTTVFQWEDVGKMTRAQVDMSGVTESEEDRLTWDLNTIPLPIIHKGFRVNIRALNASRRLGQTLDVAMAGAAGRMVAEEIEEMLVNGASALNYGGGVLRGYLDFGDRNILSLAVQWDASAKTGNDILDDVLAMKQVMINDRMFGPYVLYVPTNYETVLDDDFKAESDRTVRERILAIDNINSVRVLDILPDDEVLMIQMQMDTVALIDGMQPTTVQWESQGGMVTHFKVMAIIVPRIASDHIGQCGIVHLS